MVEVMELTEPNANDRIARHFGRNPIVVQLQTVFAIVAPATRSGAGLIDRCKERLPGKTYSVLMGDVAPFLGLSRDTPLSEYLLDPNAPERLEEFSRDLRSTFLRMPVAPRSQSSKALCEGTLQGLVLGGVLAQKMRWMEKLTESLPDKLFGRAHGGYAAPIASSCNMSGDPAGSITDFDTALDFARRRGVGLLLTNRGAGSGGSNPIFGLRHDRVETFREGPGVTVKRRLLEGWLERALAHQPHRDHGPRSHVFEAHRTGTSLRASLLG